MWELIHDILACIVSVLDSLLGLADGTPAERPQDWGDGGAPWEQHATWNSDISDPLRPRLWD